MVDAKSTTAEDGWTAGEGLVVADVGALITTTNLARKSDATTVDRWVLPNG